MLYCIGDLHLSLAGGKEMDVFGGGWVDYVKKIEASFSKLSEEDTIVLCGDTSWGMSLEQALPDFEFLERLPGRKILLKGNHDYFWETATKMKRFFAEHSLTKLDVLFNNAFLYGTGALCGTRGWFFEEEKGNFSKVFNRELIRLRATLEAGRRLTDGELVAFLHYPPLYDAFRCDEMIAILKEFDVKRCYYGHLHGYGRAKAVEGLREGIDFRLISADNVHFTPVPLVL